MKETLTSDDQGITEHELETDPLRAPFEKEQENHYLEIDPLRVPPKDKERGFKEKLLNSFKQMSYEPVFIIYHTCYVMTLLTFQTLIMEKACRVDLNWSNETCTMLRLQEQAQKNLTEEELLQKYVAPVINLRTYITIGAPCLLLPFVGTFTDKTGYRKLIPMIQFGAQILISINDMLQVFFMHETGVYFFVVTQSILEGTTGGFACLSLIILTHIATVTSEEDRTFRMGWVFFAQSVSVPIGLCISGPLLRYCGYYWCYGLSGILNLFNLVYTIVWIKDAKRSSRQKQHDGHGFFYFVRLFFDLTNLKETVRVVFKSGPNNRRLRMCVLLVIVAMLFGPVYGELAIVYISTRYRFGWNEVDYSMFQMYNFLSHTVGTIFSLIVFSKILKWHDSVLGIISTVSKIASSFIYCFAKTPLMFYMAPAVEILNGTALLAMRSIVTKFVLPEELGKVNSIFGLTENLMPVLYVPLYTTVYTATMEVLPGAVFLMGATMTIPAVMVFLWLFYEHRLEGNQHSKQPPESADTILNSGIEQDSQHLVS